MDRTPAVREAVQDKDSGRRVRSEADQAEQILWQAGALEERGHAAEEGKIHQAERCYRMGGARA